LDVRAELIAGGGGQIISMSEQCVSTPPTYNRVVAGKDDFSISLINAESDRSLLACGFVNRMQYGIDGAVEVQDTQ
jgi:hypothetical protein